MSLAPANQSQLVRASQKDEYYQRILRNNVNDVFQTLGGSKRWLDWRRELEVLSDLTYYVLTTLSGYQTLGEEYVSIVQVDATKRRIPSHARRGLLVLLHSVLPYVLNKMLMCVRSELEGYQQSTSLHGPPRSGGWSLEGWLRRRLRHAHWLSHESHRRACLHTVLVIQEGVAFLRHLHMAWFFISASHRRISERCAGVSYMGVAAGGEDRTVRTSFAVQGSVLLLQLLATLCLQHGTLRRRWSTAERRQRDGNRPQHARRTGAARCILCLEDRRDSTATPCGHLFCWDCISEWCSTKAECPLCREPVQPHRLVYLRNYS